MTDVLAHPPQQSPLCIPLRVSRRYAALLGLMHLGGLAILFTVNLPGVLRGLIGIVLMASWFWQWRHLPGTNHGIQSLQELASGEWQLSYAQDEPCISRLRAYCLFSHYVVLLHFKPGAHRTPPGVVVLFPDAMSASLFRRLKVRLTTWRFTDA